ncbi:MAG: DUF2961 domain-containing protein [Bryobacteraceae bacterium]
MWIYRRYLVFAASLLLPLLGQEPPVIPVGADAYKMWDKWAYQRIGTRAYMRSTYDRLGGNHTADASHFLYQEADDFNVTLDVAGPGMLYFARYNHWHGSPWHYEVDGKDNIVQETSTANPRKPVPDSVFLPEHLFPNPLTWTWSVTKGADLMWVPIGFEKTFRMAYSRTFYGTGYYIYHQYVRGAKLSQPVKSWDGQTAPDAGIAALLNRAGTDIAPAAGRDGTVEQKGQLRLGARETAKVWESTGARMIRALEFSAPVSHALALSKVRLRVRWDGRPEPSIDAPVALFYGTGILHNQDNREYLVKGLPMVVQFKEGRVHLRCFFPMPFFRSARIELVGVDSEIADVRWSVRHQPFRDPANHVGYFHATYQDIPKPEIGRDMVLLDTTKTEGGGDWSGSFVGTSLIFTHNGVLNTLEGDPRFFFDDSQTPQAQGTGTEEWGGGGDYWGGRNMTLPLAGHPVGVRRPEDAKVPEDKIHSAYRFLLADLMPFGKNARIQFEHGGTNLSTEHYETVSYWYGLPAASLVRTDVLKIGDAESERAHGYVSPNASEVYELTSRYELGPDTLERLWPNLPPVSGEGREVYPAHTDSGRYTTGVSEFNVKLERNNLGVLLRRKLDYSLANQRAEIFIGPPDAKEGDWKPAGVWYLAGSNACVYSYPPDRDELGATQHNVEISNRRFRDDEFLVPRDLTAGKEMIRVRVKFTPVDRPLVPGQTRSTSFRGWSEFRYDVYSYVMPRFQ